MVTVKVFKRLISIMPCFLLLLQPVMVSAECACDGSYSGERENPEAHILKLTAVCSILAAGALGVLLPIVGKRIPSLSPDKNIFLLVKAFAAGVILATGFVHVLPDAFENLTSPCLVGGPWQNFPFTGIIAMAAAIATLMIETLATSYYRRAHFGGGGGKALPVTGDEEMQGGHEGHVHVHTHASHGHAHVSAVVPEDLGSEDLVGSVHDRVLRHRIVTQVLELGIVVHSVIIGVSLGASENPSTIKPLVAALSFHQMFEGMGLGGCISQAKFKSKSIAVMVMFFSLTTPLGIVMGMGISNRYRENSPSAVAVEGSLNAASSGILVYMALVDLLAPDFMSPKMTNNLLLQIGANISLLLGSACMSLLAIWA